MQTHPRLRQLIRALARSRSGNTAVEFAFIAPAMLMFIFGVAEVGRVLWLQNALDYSGRGGGALPQQ
jgi:Flp pilus assembly protein TadG